MRARKPEPDTSATWTAYAAAYLRRYGVEPMRNARVSGQLAQLVQRVPREEAPAIAAAYVRSNNARYVATGHSVGCLLQDAEKLRTEWATGQRGTASAARRADSDSDRADQYADVRARLRALDQADAAAAMAEEGEPDDGR